MKKLLYQLRQAYRHSGPADMSEEAKRSDLTAKTTVSLLMSAASLLLTLLNVVNHYWFMMGTTLALTLGFLLCALLYGKFRKRSAATAIMAVLVGVVFSIYAITGRNEGFAILWILLVPPVGMALIGLRAGTALSAYFQLFLVVLFYTPLRSLVAEHYTATFCIRFPLLYLTSFAAAVLLTSQKQYYYLETENLAYRDVLTGVFNRRYYESRKQRILEEGRLPELTLISIDVNRLKYTNDTFGHQAGDLLLTSAVKCMRTAFPDADAICRTGGDEFIITTFAEPGRVRQEIKALLKEAEGVHLEFTPELSFSLGFACHSEHPEMDYDTLERSADAAMYDDKEDFYIAHNTGRGKA